MSTPEEVKANFVSTWGAVPGCEKPEFLVLCESTSEFCSKLDTTEYVALDQLVCCGEQVLREVSILAETSDVNALIQSSADGCFQTIMDNTYYAKLAADFWLNEISRIWRCEHAQNGARCLKSCIRNGFAFNVFQTVSDDLEQEEFMELHALTNAEQVGSERRRVLVEHYLKKKTSR